jgi:pimeloyl-ACP methyl ester carboxylesterase
MRQGSESSRAGRTLSLWILVALAPTSGCGVERRTDIAAPPALERHTVDSDGHPMAVWEKSPAASAATVLLLHGRTWSTLPDFDLQVQGEGLSLMDALNARSVRAFGLDARGYGATPRDSTGWLTPDRAARDVVNALEWIREQSPGEPPPVLFGWSYGSMVAQLAAQRRPDLVSGIVLYGYPYDPARPPRPSEVPDEPARTPTTAEAAASDFVVDGAISARAVQAYVEAALAADPVRTDWKDLEQWQELEAARVIVPTLLIEGESDPLTSTDAHVAVFTGLGTADKSWIVLAGGDHAAMLETPHRHFADAVAAFVRRCGGRS